MTIHRIRNAAIPIVALAVLAAACGHSGSSSSSSTGSGSHASSRMSTISAAGASGVGTVLVDGSGRTLYMLSADKGGMVTCTSTACTASWPPVFVSSAPSGGTGVSASLLGTARTPSGKMQATYNNWPLYLYSGDTAAGQANGQDIQSFGGVWHPLAKSGQPVAGSSASSGGGY